MIFTNNKEKVLLEIKINNLENIIRDKIFTSEDVKEKIYNI